MKLSITACVIIVRITHIHVKYLAHSSATFQWVGAARTWLTQKALKTLLAGRQEVKLVWVPNEASEERMWKAKVFGTCHIPSAIVGDG